MRIRVLYFSSAKARAGTDSEELEMASGATVAAAIDLACSRHAELGALRGSLLAAVNEEWTPRDLVLAEGDTLALMPPVSGG